MNAKTKTIHDRLLNAFGKEESKEYAFVNNILVVLIFSSVLFMVLESVELLESSYSFLFELAELVIVAIFTLEFIANLYVAQKIHGSLFRYLFSFWGIIDLLAILPTYLNLINLSALKAIRVFRILRFLRMLRVLKLAKHTARGVKKAQEKKTGTLKYDLQIYFFALISVVIVFGTLAFFAEGEMNPQFADIPTSMWWAFVTITTVGYGDIAPITLLGRVVAIPTMLSGLALFGMLMNVVGKAMMDLLFGNKGAKAEDQTPNDKETKREKIDDPSSTLLKHQQNPTKTVTIHLEITEQSLGNPKISKALETIIQAQKKPEA